MVVKAVASKLLSSAVVPSRVATAALTLSFQDGKLAHVLRTLKHQNIDDAINTI